MSEKDLDAIEDVDEIPNSAYVDPEERGEYVDTGPVPQQSQHQLNQQAPGEDITDERILEDANRPDSWLVYNKGLEELGYTTADTLTPRNVDSLDLEWVIETPSSGLETNPLVVPSDPPVMYFITNNGVVYAVNARNGDVFWKYQYSPTREVGHNNSYWHRGVALYQDKVFMGTHDTFVLALNRYTGEKLWKTSTLVDDPEYPQKPFRKSYSEAPVAFNGNVYIGQVGDTAGWSVVTAIDTSNGEEKWHQRTAPKDEWIGDSWKFSSAAGWMSPTYDPETDSVFWSLANPNPVNNGVVRPGTNNKSNSLIRLDAETGEVIWNRQLLPHELWDYDVHTTPYVYDAEIEDETRRVVSVDWKTGWTYTYDVQSGVLVERTRPWAKQGREGDTFLSTPPAGRENAKIMYPNTAGATEWPPDAYSPKTGLRYIGVNNAANKIWYLPGWEQSKATWTPEGAIGGGYPPLDEGEKPFEYHTLIKAVDPVTGDIEWSFRYPQDDYQGYPGGATATGGNLVFQGTADGQLFGFNARTGEKVWKDNTYGRIVASPVIWEDPDPEDERQFMSVAVDDKIVTYVGSEQ